MSNFVTIETDIEPPYVVVNLADWNTMNEALTAESKRAKSAERRVAELEALVAEAWIPSQEPPPEDTDVEMIVRGRYNWQLDEWTVLPTDEQLISDHVLGWRANAD